MTVVSQTQVVKPNKLGGKVWTSILLFGLMGQIAWVVENVYFSTFIQKISQPSRGLRR